MTGPVRTSPRVRNDDQPPRPPNAWILYRSDRVREMPPPLPGQLRTQADVSKAISEQWRNESETTRAEYERRAEMKKAEHHTRYPDYRFRPKTKEQKERQRLEKKQQKERQPKRTRTRARAAAPVADLMVAQTNTSQPLPHPAFNASYIPSYYAEARFGPAGPSPPLSAAPSPRESNSSLESVGAELQIPPSPHPDYSHALPHSTMPLSSRDAIPITPHSQIDLLSSNAPTTYFAPNQWSQMDDASPPSSSSLNAMTPSVPLWDLFGTPQAPVNNLVSPDFVSFDLQPNALQNVRSWMNEPGAFNEAMQVLLSATGDPSIFQLDNFDANALTSNPLGEIEVSMGQPTPYPFDLIPDFSGFDFNPPSSTASQVITADGRTSIDEATDFFSGDIIYSDHQTYNADDFINFDGVPSLDPTGSPADMPSTSQILDRTSETLHATPYAAHSSTRRAATSWKPSFDSHIEVSPPRSWGVPAM